MTNFIRYLAVLIILFPLTCVEAKRMFSQIKTVKTKLGDFTKLQNYEKFPRLFKCMKT